MRISESAPIRGLIPARAGNTWLAESPRSPGRAHPRSRGEHRTRKRLYRKSSGSSPLARGTHPCVSRPNSSPGLIPARAGNTTRSPRSGTRYGAHPRSRGEHILARLAPYDVKGSSPLARGTHLRHNNTASSRGLIPARAGNTPARICVRLLGWAHPRSRGEHTC